MLSLELKQKRRPTEWMTKSACLTTSFRSPYICSFAPSYVAIRGAPLLPPQEPTKFPYLYGKTIIPWRPLHTMPLWWQPLEAPWWRSLQRERSLYPSNWKSIGANAKLEHDKYLQMGPLASTLDACTRSLHCSTNPGSQDDWPYNQPQRLLRFTTQCFWLSWEPYLVATAKCLVLGFNNVANVSYLV